MKRFLSAFLVACVLFLNLLPAGQATTISRLRSTEISNGQAINATYLSEEFDQLVNEHNAKETRLTNIESGPVTLTGNKTFSGATTFSGQAAYTADQPEIRNFIQGLAVAYATAATLTIAAGSCRDSANTATIRNSASLTVDISLSGAGGLDTGVEAISTGYYVWLIGKTDGTVAGLLSVSDTAPTMPAGYTLKRLIGYLYNNASGAIEPFYSLGDRVRDFHYMATPTILLSAGTATSKTTVSVGAQTPAYARCKQILAQGYLLNTVAPTTSGSTTGFLYPEDNASYATQGPLLRRVAGTAQGNGNWDGLIRLNSSKAFGYANSVADGSPEYSLYLTGFRMEL